MREKVNKQEKELEKIKSKESISIQEWLEKENYKSIDFHSFPKGLLAYFDLENASLNNQLNTSQKAKMSRQFSKNEKAVFTEGYRGNGLLLDGEAWLDLDKVGIFQRSKPFSIGLHINIPADLENGQIFHKGVGTRLHSYRGYHLALKNNKFELMMAHTWPENAIVEYADINIPREEWIQLTITYDGSSKAEGLKLFMNGEELKTEVEVDNLYKDIIFHDLIDPIYPQPIEPGLQIGARWRGKGIKGAKVDDILVFDRELSALEVLQIGDLNSFKEIISNKYTELSEKNIELLSRYYLTNKVAAIQKETQKLADLRHAYVDSVEEVQEVMVMREMPKRRKAFVLERGQYDSYGEEVFPNTLKAFLKCLKISLKTD